MIYVSVCILLGMHTCTTKCIYVNIAIFSYYQEIIRLPEREVHLTPAVPSPSSSLRKKQQQQQRRLSPSPSPLPSPKKYVSSVSEKKNRVKSVRMQKVVKYSTTGSAATKPSRRRQQRRACAISSSSAEAAELGRDHSPHHQDSDRGRHTAQPSDSPIRRRARVVSYKASRPSSKHLSPFATAAASKKTTKSSKCAKGNTTTTRHDGRHYKTVSEIKETDAWLLL